MDFDKLLDGYKCKACIISVDRYPDGSYGNIRIAAGNKAHCDDMLNVMHRPFVPDSPYAEYLPENKNFEDFCFRCAFGGEPLHTYVSLHQMGLWLNMFLLPLESDKKDTGYCIYSYDVTVHESDQRASLSADTSSAVLATCIKLRGSDDIRRTFNEVIEDIRQICDSDHCCILLTDDEKRSCTTLCEALKPGCGMLPMDTYLDAAFYDITRTWKDTIGGSTCVIIKNSHDMEWLRSINPVWHDSLAKAGAKSIVMFPLKYNNETLGYMWAINFNVDNTVKIKETLELTTFFIASEIANFQLLQRLEVLSSVDMLTGVKNRNIMNNIVDSIIAGRITPAAPYAVVFADLNGLKRINDEQGHSAGDQLLKTAAAILRVVFYDTDVYRAGGDEFMIITSGLDEKALGARLQRLEEQAESAENVHFAVGSCFVTEDVDICTAMRLADERMYVNKNDYYNNHPERRYR